MVARPAAGRPPKLTHAQEKVIRRWLADKPTEHGFPTDLWTGPRLAHMIRQEFDVDLNPKYLTVWLRQSRVHPAEAPSRPSPTRPGGDRRVVGLRLAAHQKKARRQHAHIALIDESGLLMAPLVRRTWAPRGRTPDFVQTWRPWPREKVSVAAALWLSPRRDRLGLYSKTLVNGYFDNWYMAAFLEAMMHDLDGRFVVVWDGGPMHKGDPIHQLTDRFADRLCLEALPPWAPMLNPTEPLWGWLTYGRLCNYAPQDAAELDGRVVAELATVESDQEFLRNLVSRLGTPASPDITFLTCCNSKGR